MNRIESPGFIAEIEKHMPPDTNARKTEHPPSASNAWRFLRAVLRVPSWICIGIPVVLLLSFLLHTYCRFCPFTLSVIRFNEEMPMRYGYFFSTEPEWQGKIALGGCMVLPISTICPRCSWPMRYCDPSAPDAMPHLDVDATFSASLSEQARTSLRTYVGQLIAAHPADAPEAVVAAAVGPSGLWLATRNQGLHRMNLETGNWTTNRDGQPWRCFVKAIAIQGTSVQVEYSPFGAPTYFQTAATLDEGHTWQLTSGPLPLLP